MLQLQNLVDLQELSKFSNWAHNAEHKVDHELHKVNWKGLGIGAWHGLTWCYSDDKCHAAVEKYGSKAVEDGAEAAGEEELMELSRIGNWSHKVDNKIKAAFHKIDWKHLGIGAWHGITWCYSDDKCHAAIAKYGEKAVEDAGEDAVEVAALQELSRIGNWSHKVDDKIKAAFHKIDWKSLGLGAWHGITWCYSDDKCHAAIAKYGEKAVEDAGEDAVEVAALQELSKFGNWVHKEEGHIKSDFKKIDWKHLGAGAWHGVTACYSNEKCRAAVAKYGLHAVEDAGEDAVEVAALMELESGAKKFFTGKDNTKIKNFFKGKDDHRITDEIKHLGLGAWHGVQHCDATPKCKDAVEKYGLLAVKIAVGVALAPVGALQNMQNIIILV